jgi:hypothetical protein
VDFLQEERMDKSVDQARWLLGPMFTVAIIFLAVGMSLG